MNFPEWRFITLAALQIVTSFPSLRRFRKWLVVGGCRQYMYAVYKQNCSGSVLHNIAKKIAVVVGIKSRTCAHFLRHVRRHRQRIWYESTSVSNFIALNDVVCQILQGSPPGGTHLTCQVEASHTPKCHWLYALCENAHDRGHGPHCCSP